MPIALITGANAGIGFATAQALAQQGFELILCCRNPQKAAEAEQKLLQQFPKAQIESLICDLADLQSVKNTCSAFAQTRPHLDVLVNNAGFYPDKQEFSSEGIELTFLASHLGHFVLTQCLLPLLEKAQDPRIVNVSSEAHRFGDANRFFTRHNASSMQTYGDAKLANILFTMGFRQQYPQTKIRAYSLHPGMVITNFVDKAPKWLKFLSVLARPFMIHSDKGASTSVYLANTPTSKIPDSVYFEKSKPQKIHNSTATAAAAQTLWEKSQQIYAQLA